MKRMRTPKTFALCIRADAGVDLEPRKAYEVLPDRVASRDGYLRVIDESGEDYLYPAAYFVTVRLPATVMRDLTASETTNQPANIARKPRGGARRTRRAKLAARG
jgi:hypothetical protein